MSTYCIKQNQIPEDKSDGFETAERLDIASTRPEENTGEGSDGLNEQSFKDLKVIPGYSYSRKRSRWVYGYHVSYVLVKSLSLCVEIDKLAVFTKIPVLKTYFKILYTVRPVVVYDDWVE